MRADRYRQTGRTSAQLKALKALKPNALFVWCNGDLYYPEKLAEHLGVKNIRIVKPMFIMDQAWRGLRFSEVVLDHAYHACNRHNATFQEYLAILRSKCDTTRNPAS